MHILSLFFAYILYLFLNISVVVALTSSTVSNIWVWLACQFISTLLSLEPWQHLLFLCKLTLLLKKWDLWSSFCSSEDFLYCIFLSFSFFSMQARLLLAGALSPPWPPEFNFRINQGWRQSWASFRIHDYFTPRDFPTALAVTLTLLSW